jgi:hypothetical protein
MTLSTLKASIIKKINSSDNFELLSEVKRLMDIGSEAEEVYLLSDEQKTAINEARADYAKGNFLSDDEANEEIEKWL